MTESNPPGSYPANWYPDTNNAGQERYYDGTIWTEHVRPAQPIVTSVADPAPKKPLNILGIVALAVSAVGFIFACIPGALILGWVLLPIGFILGIVALFQKDKPKWQGLTAIILSVVGTIVGVVVFFSLVGGAVDDAIEDAVADDVGSSEVADDEDADDQEPAIAGPEDLVLGETAFGVDPEDGMGWYAVQITNPNEDYVFASSALTVEAFDAAGVLLDSDSSYSTILSGETWYTGTFFDIGAGVIDHIEVRGPVATDATHAPAAQTGTMTIQNIVLGSEYDWMKVTGQLVSEFSEDQDMVRIDLIARDAGGKIVGVDSTYTDRVPAGGTVAWEVSFWEVPLDSAVTAFPHL